MICPQCGESNSYNFRFCGMCGNLLESRRPVGTAPLPNPEAAQQIVAPQIVAPRVAPSQIATPQIASSRIASPGMTGPNIPTAPSTNPQESPRSFVERRGVRKIPPLNRPSMLGLDQPVASRPSPSQSSPLQSSAMQPNAVRPGRTQPNEARPNEAQPDLDLLRDKAFTGLDSFLEPEQPKSGGRRVLLLMALLVALAGAGWWTYGYLNTTENHSTKPSAQSAAAIPAGQTSAAPSSAPPADSSQTAQSQTGSSQTSPSRIPPSPATLPETPPQNASASPESAPKTATPEATPADNPAPVIPAAVTPKVALGDKSAEKRKAAPAAKTPAPKASKLHEPAQPPAAPDAGSADFRRGEAFLYGRGAPENCDEAVKNLKSASAKSNAKARSAFGTMYATGHCVPRDLPTSYLWFAMALQVDPNNQILEKDLSAVWNQMTPPERQLAERMKK